MPFSEVIGKTLPLCVSLFKLMLIVFILGVGVTLSEPAIAALRMVGALLSPQQAPYLYLLLNDASLALQLAVGVGVGSAALVGTLRQLRGWSLKLLVGITVVPTLLLTGYIMLVHPELDQILGLAWDCGAVTTCPVS